MNKTLLVAAVVLAGTFAQANPKPRTETGAAKAKANTTAVETNRPNKGASTGQDTLTSATTSDFSARLLENAKKISESNTKFAIRTEIELATEATKAAETITEPNAKASFKNLINYLSRIPTTPQSMAFIAKIFDLASRKEVGANNPVYKKLIEDFGKNLSKVHEEFEAGTFKSADIVTEALNRTVSKERREMIEQCV